jgi:hypothetical protein
MLLGFVAAAAVLLGNGPFDDVLRPCSTTQSTTLLVEDNRLNAERAFKG